MNDLANYNPDLLARIPDTHEVFVYDGTPPEAVEGWLFIDEYSVEIPLPCWRDVARWTDGTRTRYGVRFILARPKVREPWIDPSVELEPGMMWAVRGQPLGDGARRYIHGSWRLAFPYLYTDRPPEAFTEFRVGLIAVRAPAAASPDPGWTRPLVKRRVEPEQSEPLRNVTHHWRYGYGEAGYVCDCGERFATRDEAEKHEQRAAVVLRIPDGWEMVPAAADVSAWVARGEGDVGFDDFVPGLRYFEPGTDQDMHEVAFCEVAGLWPPCEGYGVTWCLIRRVEPEQRAAEPESGCMADDIGECIVHHDDDPRCAQTVMVERLRRDDIARGFAPAWDGGPSGSVTGQPHVPREVRDAAAIVVETIEGAESECDALAVFRRCERREGRTLVSLRALHLRMLAERDETWVRGGYTPEPSVEVGVQEQSPWAEDL